MILKILIIKSILKKNNALNIEPPKIEFTFNGYSYLPYNNKRIIENR